MRLSFSFHSKLSSFFLLLFVLILSSCTKELSLENEGLNPARAVVLQNQSYGGGTRQQADIHLPANRSINTPVLIMLHGGSWAEGDKADIAPYVAQLKIAFPELAIINMNYTLANGTAATRHPAQINDIDALVAFYESRRNQWKLGTRIGIGGVSAGAHLAMLYAYAHDPQEKMKVAVSIVGPTDFSDPFYSANPLFQLVANNLLGQTWAQNPDLHRAVSPALRVTGAAPPTFLAYGTLDPIVPISNAITLRNNLVTANVTHTYVEYPGEEHEFTPTAVADLLPRLVTFLRTHL